MCIRDTCGETLGDLEPVYDLFAITSEFSLPEAVTQTSGVKRVVFLTVKQECGETLGDLEPVYDYKRIHLARGCDTMKWCETGRFSYSESPRTPPLEGTSLHR